VVYWVCFEWIKNRMKPVLPTRDFLINFVSGAASGSVAATLTIPVDVMKTRRQMYIHSHTTTYPITTRGIFSKIVSEEGFLALFNGLVPRLAKVAPACAIMISSYEFFKKMLVS